MNRPLTLCVFLTVHLAAFATLARPTFGKNGLVVSCSDLASQAGTEILKKGGNAADAALATAFTLAVTRPYYGSLGGGGLMIVKFGDDITTLDHRERAPRAAKENMYLIQKPKASQIGGLAVATPGNVRGLLDLHKKYGKLPLTVDLAPAISFAKNGFMVDEEFARMTREVYPDFNVAGKKIFSLNGKELSVGDHLKQPGLALALELISKKGADGFYKGLVAADLIAAIKDSGGLIDQSDLDSYETVWRAPLKAHVFNSDIYTMPPPSSGGALLIEELKLSELLKVDQEKPWGAEQFHLMAEIMARAFFDRQYLADPQYAVVPADEIYRDEHVQKWVSTIDRRKKTNFDPKKFELKGATNNSPEGGNTTHYVVVDKQGNVVSATTTLNGDYGSAVASAKFGIVLNNEMDDFTTHPGQPNMFGLVQGKANAVAPLKTPLSSMTPTIVQKDGKLFMALGSPGGPRIINAVYQVLFHALTTPFNMDEIIQSPRIHHQSKPDKLFVDRTLSPDTQAALEKMGHVLSETSGIARVYGIRVTPDGLFEGAFDNRGVGGASGY